jgi:hypothetical protein
MTMSTCLGKYGGGSTHEPPQEDANIYSQIDSVLTHLSDENLWMTVHLPIERAHGLFQPHPSEQYSTKNLFGLMGDYVQVLYARGLQCPKTLSRQKSQAEAIAILGADYERILREASKYWPGCVPGILDLLKGQIGSLEQSKYSDWVLQKHFDLGDWHTRVRVTYALYDAFGAYLPSDIKKGPPERFAGLAEQLLLNVAGACNDYRRFSADTAD